MSNLPVDPKHLPSLEGGMLWVAGIVLALANFVAVLNMVSLRSMKPFSATGSPSKMYQNSSLPTSTGTLGKYSEIGPA